MTLLSQMSMAVFNLLVLTPDSRLALCLESNEGMNMIVYGHDYLFV